MLAQRIATALVLVALLLLTLWARSPWPFVLLTLLLISAAAWEWARLNGLPSAFALGCGLVLAAAGLFLSLTAGTAAESHAVWLFAAFAWVAGGAFVLHAGPQRWSRWPQGVRVAVGAMLLVVAWWALAQARFAGVNYLLSVLCIVWAADIAAYFGGRAFGRHKLAPTISPGKSWEGVVSGMLGVLALAAFWLWLDTRIATDSASLFTLLQQRFGLVIMALSVLALTAVSVMGDLFESLIKRAVGAKDSSALLPGHGGVLDRVDALLPVLPCAMALTTW
jgi:phosphatidate cytidylyltransferase